MNACACVCVFLWRFQQVNEDRVQQMERENSFIARWNDKKDTTVSRPAEPKWKPPTGVLFVCACIDLPACDRASQIRDSFERVSCFSGKNEGDGGVGGWGEGGGGRSRRVRKKGLCSC